MGTHCLPYWALGGQPDGHIYPCQSNSGNAGVNRELSRSDLALQIMPKRKFKLQKEMRGINFLISKDSIRMCNSSM